ncbi:Pentatricopeptide repeat-containing protein [Thalictrum thalictroides]|uniref:Pentatricopeptide repeat-containing protein n=1 Tax=Thalictrum thalictroides TaxID=46969 RepID=A0A7J6VXP6_THATH|nr:Pentatricopeptide repeat-containing protein [Thalictrum thalictroides]
MNAELSSSQHLLRQLQFCAKRNFPSHGKQLHAQILKTGLLHQQCPRLLNTLIDMYGKCGILEDALNLFEEMPKRDPVSWDSILSTHNQSKLPQRTLSLFPNMFKVDQLLPDNYIFATLVKACASLSTVRVGKQVHARFVSSQFYDDDVVKSSLVDMYSKCGLTEDARRVFESVSWKNSVCWTALISGYARNGQSKEAVEVLRRMPVKSLFSWTALISGVVQSGNGIDAIRLFVEMRREDIQIEDPFVLASIVGTSANLAALELGKQFHCVVVVLGYEPSVFVSNALVDMYAKCSDILAAKNVFDKIIRRDVVSWTAIIVGMAQHGRALKALSLFDEMVLVGIRPNEITFVGLIYACSHGGFVAKGRHLFDSMVNDYGIKPSLQHYTCLLDLLGRSGHLDEAYNIIKIMPFEPDEPTWAALLSACKLHGKTEMGVEIANHLLGLNLRDPSTFILLSNTYAAAGMWNDVSKVRKLMAVMEVRKEPGYSWVNLGKDEQVFYAGEIPHHLKDEIVGLLKKLNLEMKKRGYVPDTSFVLHDMEKQEKEQQLFWHSERLAVAYGLLTAVPGSTIRIVKNLRVCGDCHTVLKLISDIVQRDVVVRDASRYHHFKDGRCSCGNFW